MFQFFESIRLRDQQLFLLDQHQSRIKATFARHYDGLPAHELAGILGRAAQLRLHAAEAGKDYKVKFSYSAEQFEITISKYVPKKIVKIALLQSYKIQYPDKAADRSPFERALIQHEDFDDIIFIRDGAFTDSTYANLVFVRDNKFDTPRTHLLPGTQRAALLASKKIELADITLGNYREWSHVFLINAFNDLSDWQKRCLPVRELVLID